MSEQSPPDVEQAQEEQQALAESSLAAVFEAYDDALQEGVEHPVVLVIDCEDPLGAEISRAWLGDETVDDAIALQASDEDSQADTTVFVAAFAFADCKSEVTKVFPYLASVFESPPGDDGVLIVSVTSGGASALTASMDARP